ERRQRFERARARSRLLHRDRVRPQRRRSWRGMTTGPTHSHFPVEESDAVSGDVREHGALKWHSGKTTERSEKLAVEEPLEIRLAGRRFTLTMRTPGHDEELA